MKMHLACYATDAYHEGQQRLTASAVRFDVGVVHAWNRRRLEGTAFYGAHRAILDLPRGSGYWLWKPYIILEALAPMGQDDVLFYADSGIEITGDPTPLAALCRRQTPPVLFAGHYYRQGGPNICRKWTKRDCFVFTDCDQSRYHEAPMLDASFMVLRKNTWTISFVRQWLGHCARRSILTDDANVGGRDNFPDFIDHRHDQSVLSLLAQRHRLELFRHPSQFGNHLKLEAYRQPHEPIRFPYGTFAAFDNSPYPTLLDHHRMGRTARVKFVRS
jgi:hypothetical protein